MSSASRAVSTLVFVVLLTAAPALVAADVFRALSLQPGEQPTSETGSSIATLADGSTVFTYEPSPGITPISHVLAFRGPLPSNDAALGKVPLPHFKLRTLFTWNDTFCGAFAGHYGSNNYYKYHTLLLIKQDPDLKLVAEIDFSTSFKGAVHSARATGRPDEILVMTVKPDGLSGYNLHRCALDYVTPKCELYVPGQADYAMDLVDIVDGMAYVVHAPIEVQAAGRGSEILVVDTRVPSEAPTATRIRAQLESRTLPGSFVFRSNTFGPAVFDAANKELILHAVDAASADGSDHYLLHVSTRVPLQLVRAVKLPAVAPRDMWSMVLDPGSRRVHFLPLPAHTLAVYTYDLATGAICSQTPDLSRDRPPAARRLFVSQGQLYVGTGGQEGSGSWLLGAALPLPDCSTGQAASVSVVDMQAGPRAADATAGPASSEQQQPPPQQPPQQQEQPVVEASASRAAALDDAVPKAADAGSTNEDFQERTSFVIVGAFAIICLLLFLCTRAFVKESG